MKKVNIAGGAIFLPGCSNKIIEFVDTLLNTSTIPTAIELKLPRKRKMAEA